MATPIVADVLVIGAGPAGVAAVLALRSGPGSIVRRVAWVDPCFDSGRLARLRNVPCNTKVDLLVGPKFFNHPLLDPVKEAVEPALAHLVSNAHPLPASTDPSKLGFTDLGACKAIYDAATGALIGSEGVACIRGHVTQVERRGTRWAATVMLTTVVDAATSSSGLCAKRADDVSSLTSGTAGVSVVTTPHVVFATGSEPRCSVIGDRVMFAEDAFEAEALRARLKAGDAVAVLGNSHSAAVVLSVLRQLAPALGLRTVNFARHSARLAEWLPDLSTYRYTSTGLKGYGAVVGAECMLAESQQDWLELRPFHEFTSGDWDAIIDCTGYVATALPQVSTEAAVVELGQRDEASGRLGLAEGLPDLWAVGAPWGEPPGRLWGAGLEEAEGFKGENSFIGFHLFFDRAKLIAAEIDKRLEQVT